MKASLYICLVLVVSAIFVQNANSQNQLTSQEIYVQNASLEIAWTSVALEKNAIAGEAVLPFVSAGFEGFDINQPEDWMLAEYYLKSGKVSLPTISIKPFDE